MYLRPWFEELPVKRGEMVKDENGVYGWAVAVVMVSHRPPGILTDWSITVEYTRGGRHYGQTRVLGPDQLSVWRDGEWKELSHGRANTRGG